MKYLSELSPAECLLMLKGNTVPVKDLLKYTFLDLVLKRVLQVVEVEKPISNREGTRVYKYIKRGKAFNTYYPLKHEQAFLSTFAKERDSEILMRHFVKIFYRKTGSEFHLKSILYKYPAIKKYFRRNVFQRILGRPANTPARLEAASNIRREITELENSLPLLLQADRLKAAMILEKIKGNVFLLKDTETSLHDHVEKELSYELRKYMFGI